MITEQRRDLTRTGVFRAALRAAQHSALHAHCLYVSCSTPVLQLMPHTVLYLVKLPYIGTKLYLHHHHQLQGVL